MTSIHTPNITPALPTPPSPRRLRLLILSGLPASGKSTLSTTLTLPPFSFSRASQDDAPSRRRQEAEEMVRAALRRGEDVVVDRCGFDPVQRGHFVRIAREPEFDGKVDTWCLVLFTPIETLKSRLLHRSSHPTIPDPATGLRVLSQMSRSWSPPSPSRPEGFTRVLILPFERQPVAVEGGWEAGWGVEVVQRILEDLEGSLWRDEAMPAAVPAGQGNRGRGGYAPRGGEWRGGFRGFGERGGWYRGRGRGGGVENGRGGFGGGAGGGLRGGGTAAGEGGGMGGESWRRREESPGFEILP